MKILIYRPDKKIFDNGNVDKECLYFPNGKKYTEPKEPEYKHPLDKISRAKITSSFIEVSR